MVGAAYDCGMGKSRLRVSSRKKKFTFATLAILAIAALALSAAALVRPLSGDPVGNIPSAKYTSSPHEEPERVGITEAMSRLGDPQRPFTIAILGDSTGADRDAWPALIAEWISEKYDRPVTMHAWKEGDQSGYQAPTVIGEGENAPVTIYNASAPSRNAVYSLSNLDRMIPVDPKSVDMAFISHGHNHGPQSLPQQLHPLATKILDDAPQAALALILQNPEKVNSPHAAIETNNTDNVRLYAERFSLDYIDVRQAYIDYGDFGSLYKDNVHPDGEAGYRIWADAVIASLAK